MEILEDIKEYWIIIIAIISFLYYFYRKEVMRLEIWQNEYFDKVLMPFHLQYLKNTSMNIKKFVSRIDIYSKEYVPSYLFYLVKKKEYDKIRKILVVDYENNYPSKKGISLNSMLKITDVVGFFTDIGAFLVLIVSFPLALVFVLAITPNCIHILQKNIWFSINYKVIEILAIFTTAILLYILMYIVMILYFRMTDYNDCYSSKEKIILKLIERKIMIKCIIS